MKKEVSDFIDYLKADRNGWMNFYYKEEKFATCLGLLLIYLSPFTVYGIIQTVTWLMHHVHIYIS